MKTLKQVKLKNKRVLLRVEFNVPLQKGKIIDDKRIRSALPTINYILKQKPKQLILMTHLGRPKGEVKEELRLDPIAKRLSRLLKKPVLKLNYCIGKIPDNKLILLENLRFHKGEKKDNKLFAKKLAKNADIYVNDAFGVCHRKHASVHTITKYLPSYPGFLLEKEIKNISLLKKPKHPYVAIVGGAKLETKIPVIENLLKKVDKILIGTAIAFTFYKAMGLEIGKSIYDKESIKIAKKILAIGKNKIVLPVDIVVAKNSKAKAKTVYFDSMPKDMIGLDIGKKSIKLFKDILKTSKTVVWNGPVGFFEEKKFAKGTNEIAKTLGKLKATVIIGGGDSAAAVEKLKLKVTHISTGGGAALSLIAGKKLPGIEALR